LLAGLVALSSWLGCFRGLRKLKVCRQTLTKFRRRRLLLAPKFNSPAPLFLTGIFRKACPQAV
jgi:hypothetical protein